MCGAVGPPSLPPLEGNKRRRKNIIADHIDPVIDPNVGFVSWDVVIERLFVESDGFQALCWGCHNIKTSEERHVATERRRSERERSGGEPDESDLGDSGSEQGDSSEGSSGYSEDSI